MNRPRLAAHARLRWDAREGRYLLLSPERGLLLNATAAEILKLCTGEHTLAQIAERLAAGFPERTPADLAGEVAAFVDRIAARGLLEEAAA